MAGKVEKTVCGPQAGKEMGCCSVEAVVSVDDRGQMVLPKEIRDRAGIRAGDKLAVIGFEQGERLCCISFIKVEELTGMVKPVMGPIMKDVFQE